MYRNTLEKPSFTKHTTVPGYLCPVCDTPLLIKSGDLHYFRTADTERASEDENFHATDYEYQFMAKLSCQSPTCLQKITCLGTGIVEESYERDPEHGGWEVEYINIFTPIYFQPSLKAFNIPAGCPEEISERVQSSFNLMFASVSSALNDLRSAVELLLDNLTVPRKTDKGARLNLKDRITKLPPQHQYIRDNLLALRIVGNSGSHAGDVNRSDLFDSYEVMHSVLQRLFPLKVDTDRIDQITRNFLMREKQRQTETTVRQQVDPPAGDLPCAEPSEL